MNVHLRRFLATVDSNRMFEEFQLVYRCHLLSVFTLREFHVFGDDYYSGFRNEETFLIFFQVVSYDCIGGDADILVYYGLVDPAESADYCIFQDYRLSDVCITVYSYV